MHSNFQEKWNLFWGWK